MHPWRRFRGVQRRREKNRPQRGFQPWYAYQPGTERWKRKLKYGALAFGNWLAHSYVGKDIDTGKRLEMVYKG